jgi:hypothetical protein
MGWYGNTVKSHGVDVPKDMVPAWDTLHQYSAPDSALVTLGKKYMPIIASDVFQTALASILNNEGGYYKNDPSYMGINIGTNALGKIGLHRAFDTLLYRTGARTDTTFYAPSTLKPNNRKALELAVAIILANNYWRSDIDKDGKTDPDEVQQFYGELAFNGGSGRAQALVVAALTNLKDYQGDLLTAMACEYLKRAYNMAENYNYDDTNYGARLTRYGDLLAAHGRNVTYTKDKDTRSGTLTVDGVTYTFKKPAKQVKKTIPAKPTVKKPTKAKGKLKTKTTLKAKGTKPKQPSKKPAQKH